MVAEDKRPLTREGDDHGDEEMQAIKKGGDDKAMFSERLPNAVHDEEEHEAGEEAALRDGAHDDDDDEENEEDDDGGSNSDFDAGHVYGQRSLFNRVLPSKGYAVFACGVLLSLFCYITIPIVCLGASYNVLQYRETLPETVAAASQWTDKMLKLDKLNTRLKIFALYGDGMLLAGQNMSQLFDTSALDETGAVVTWSKAAQSVLDDYQEVLRDVDATVEYLATHKSGATDILDLDFVSNKRPAMVDYMSTTYFPEVLRLFGIRKRSRTTRSPLMYTLFMQVFTVQMATNAAASLVLTAEAASMCSQDAACVQQGGLLLAQSIQSNVTNAIFRTVYTMEQTISFFNQMAVQSVPSTDSLNAVKTFNKFLLSRRTAQALVDDLYANVIAALTRLSYLQKSNGGPINTTVVTQPTANETSFVAMISPSWADQLITTLTSSKRDCLSSFNTLSSIVTTYIDTLLYNGEAISLGLELRPIHPVSVFDSIYAYDFDVQPAPSNAYQAQQTAKFNSNPLNSFFPQVRAAYQILINESTTAALDIIQVELSNSAGQESIKRIQIATSIGAILPAIILRFMLYGVELRLPSSTLPYGSMVTWVGITYAIIVAAAASIAMIAINQIDQLIHIRSEDVLALASSLSGASRASQALVQVMGVLLLIQPNTTAPLINLPSSMQQIQSIIAEGLDAPYLSGIQAIQNNMTEPFLGAPLSALTIRELLSPQTSFGTTSITNLENVASEAQFDALPLCNRSRIVGTVNFLLDSFGALQRILDIVTFGQSSLSSRIAFQPTRAAKLFACSLCGVPASQAMNPACRRPAPQGLQSHPRQDGAYLQLLMYITRSGWVLDQWNTTMTTMSSHISLRRNDALTIVTTDTTQWRLQRRLLVWLSVFGALLLQVIWYAVWKLAFDHTLHGNLIP